MSGTAGIIASGHASTSDVGRELLAAGGNAFDAALGALCAACVCEPLLTSLGGGGFLLAQPADGEPVLFDFFAHTPRRRRHASELDFYPILADFGTATQEFHIGLGAMAVPGVVAGIFEIHDALCSLPMRDIMAPAIRLARAGVPVTEFQHYVGNILLSILQADARAMRLVATDERRDRIARAGETVRQPELADTFETLAAEGPGVFYRGAWAQRLVADCGQGGGQLTMSDLAAYRVIRRAALQSSSHGADFAFNAPPSPGGSLVAFSLAMLEGIRFREDDWGSETHTRALVHAMRAASRLRGRAGAGGTLSEDAARKILAADTLHRLRTQSMPAELFSRGTTHQSVADEHGNLASLTTSNGEGCAYVLPGTGIMMNNMLGEEDLNPGGFQQWPADRRLASMMCPTLARLPDGGQVALGTGGSNRIRSAILQVLVNMFGFGMTLEHAVAAPRLHLERDYLSMEAGFPRNTVTVLTREWPQYKVWMDLNMFFGGVHAVERLPDGSFRGAGDRRRGGAVAVNP